VQFPRPTYHLYAVIDIYSRYVVGWMVADRENSALARLLLETTIRQQRCDPTRLTIHADRGSSMKSKPVAFMLADLGVTKSHSRPHVSNDNPYIEALFKTTKYQPEFPATFANMAEARSFCRTFYGWYNREHRHSGIALFTADVHYGRVQEKVDDSSGCTRRRVCSTSRTICSWSATAATARTSLVHQPTVSKRFPAE
jgi:putative transposase